MTTRIPTRPDLVGTVPRALKTTQTRILQAEDPAATDAQRIAAANSLRTNAAIARVNQLTATPFGEGQLLTQPIATGGRAELLTLAAGANDIPHTLGRPVQGFAVVDLQGAALERRGAFHSEKNQAAAAIDDPTPVVWDVLDLQQGVTSPGSSSEVYVDTAGTYDFQFSLQLDKAGGGDALIYVWCRVNGADVPWTASRLRIKDNDDEDVAAWDFLLELDAGDRFELMWATDDLNAEIHAFAATAFAPETPSAILTVMGPAGPIITRTERTRSLDERSILLNCSVPCQARIWVW
jgi:hypothetical protein